MRLENFTLLPDASLREIIRFVCPSGVQGFDIAFKNCARGYRGRAYIGGSGLHSASMTRKTGKASKLVPFVVVALDGTRQRVNQSRNWKTSYQFKEGGGYLGVRVYSTEEAAVYVTAHELRHLWQTRVPKGRRVWGARGTYSERDACAYGIRKLREWRRRLTPQPQRVSARNAACLEALRAEPFGGPRMSAVVEAIERAISTPGIEVESMPLDAADRAALARFEKFENAEVIAAREQAATVAVRAKVEEELDRVEIRLKAWRTKAKRAATALRKLERRKRHLTKKAKGLK